MKYLLTAAMLLCVASNAVAAEAIHQDQRALFEAEIRFRKQLAVALAEMDQILAHAEGRTGNIRERARRVRQLGQQITSLIPKIQGDLGDAREKVARAEDQVRRWEEQSNIPKTLLTGLANSASGGFLGLGTMGDVGAGVGVAGLSVATILAIMRARRNGSVIDALRTSGHPMLNAAGNIGNAFVAPPVVNPDDVIRDETRRYQNGPQGVASVRP